MKLLNKTYDGPLPPGRKSKAEPDVRMVRCAAQDQRTGSPTTLSGSPSSSACPQCTWSMNRV